MSYHPVAGLGDLVTMSPETVAALTACTNNCDAKYGVVSGHPDAISLTLCFGGCNAQYPPTVATPAGPVTPGVTPPPPTSIPFPLPSIPGLLTPPAPTPGPAPAPPAVLPTKPKMSTASMLAIGGGVAALAVLGYFVAKKKGWIKS